VVMVGTVSAELVDAAAAGPTIGTSIVTSSANVARMAIKSRIILKTTEKKDFYRLTLLLLTLRWWIIRHYSFDCLYSLKLRIRKYVAVPVKSHGYVGMSQAFGNNFGMHSLS